MNKTKTKTKTKSLTLITGNHPLSSYLLCYDMEVGENRVYILRYREKGVRRRETRDIYRRHQPRLQPAVSDPCIYVTC